MESSYFEAHTKSFSLWFFSINMEALRDLSQEASWGIINFLATYLTQLPLLEPSVLTNNSSDFLEHTPFLSYKNDHFQAYWNTKQSSHFTTGPLKATLIPPSTLGTARNFHFFPVPAGSRREVLMSPLRANTTFLDCRTLNYKSVALLGSGCECVSVLPLLKFCQLESRFSHPVFQSLIHKLPLVLQCQ